MQETMDELLNTFNATIGKEQGIIVNVTSVNSLSVLQEKLLMIARGDPGAPESPDLVTCYPKVAIALAEKGLLADLDEYFSDEELSMYVPSFIDEGRFNDGLYVFPIAKSTEVLFVNKTFFDRFSEDTGVTLESLSTFEGIAEAARRYYQWTDEATPDLENDGKAFFAVDSVFNLTQVAMRQLGDSFVEDGQLKTSGDSYNRVHETLLEAAVKGGYAVYDGYSSDLSKTGDIVCSIGSTAGVVFYGDTVTYPDNTKEKVQYRVLPYPVFREGVPVAIQRGAGMAVIRSDKKKERAAAVFLKWFTAARQNMEFVSETGYLPVTNEAFALFTDPASPSLKDDNINQLQEVAALMHKNYSFYVPPVFDTFEILEQEWESAFKSEARDARSRYLELVLEAGPDEAYRQAVAR